MRFLLRSPAPSRNLSPTTFSPMETDPLFNPLDKRNLGKAS